jgi:hypothetical protein
MQNRPCTLSRSGSGVLGLLRVLPKQFRLGWQSDSSLTVGIALRATKSPE